MNSAYEDVKIVASLEVLHQKAKIVSSMEKLWLPLLIQWGQISPGKLGMLFPRWLHILVPLSTFQHERMKHHRRRLNDDEAFFMEEVDPLT